MNTKDQFNQMLQKVASLKATLENLGPLKPEDDARLWKKLRLEWNYNSNHIEGNTLTYSEVELLLIFDKTEGKHEMREFEEMKAHDVAVSKIKEWSQDKRPISESDIRELNKTILHQPFWKEAITPGGQATRRLIKIGEYKDQPNSVQLPNGEMFEYASPAETPIQMKELVDWLRDQEDANPILVAAELHYRFVRIHPFDDGNGRVARLLLNLILMKAGYLPIVIKAAEKKLYLDALQRADAGYLEDFFLFIAKQVTIALELGIAAAKGKDIAEDGDLKKRLELLKRELSIIDPRNTIKKQFSNKVFIEITKSWAGRLFEKTLTKLRDFDELFAGATYSFSFHRGGYFQIEKGQSLSDFAESYDACIEKLQAMEESLFASQSNLAFAIHYSNLAAAGTATFDVRADISIRFDESKYIVKTTEFINGDRKTFDVYQYLFHQLLSEDEMNNLSKRLFESILSEIEFETKKRGIRQ